MCPPEGASGHRAGARRAPPSRRRTTPRRRRRAPPRPKPGRRAHVLLLGASRGATAIENRLDRAGIGTVRARTPAECDSALGDTTRVVLVVPPIADIAVARYVRELRERRATLPVLVALHGKLPRRRVRELYDSGVQAVFEWPTDAQPLLRTVVRLVGGISLGEGRDIRSGDIALEELVNERLRTGFTHFGRSLYARVRHGYVILTGRVDALWKLYAAERLASEVPGVEEVVLEGVKVTGDEQTDRAIAAAVRQVLKLATDVDPTTLAISVKDGSVTLSGTAADRHELSRAKDLIGHVRGVRGVDSYATISEKAKRQDRAVATQVRRAVRSHHGGAVDAAVFGGVAVLTGRVSTAAERKAVVQLAGLQEGVRRVVDKLRVRGRR